MSHTKHVVFRASLKPLALALSLAACTAAQAEDRPWYIGATQVFTHDNNVFRSTGTKQSDTISSTGVLGGLDLKLGRQRVYLDGNAQANRFQDLDQLNNTSYGVSTGLDWQTIEHLSGSLRYTARQNLGDYGVLGAPQEKNVEKAQQGSASIRYGFAGDLGIEGGVEGRKLDYTVSNYRDTTQDVAWAGVRWGGGGQLSFGVSGRVTKADTPLYQPLLPVPSPIPLFGPVEPDEMDRRDIDFKVGWKPSGLSTVSARISLTKEDHTAPSRSDFDGVTGGVTWEYLPTGKTKIRTSLIRDTGSETSFLRLAQLGLADVRFDNNRLNWVTRVEADWEATAKILVNGSLRHTRGEVDTLSGAGFSTHNTKFQLGARYLATRAITLGCSFNHERGEHSFSASVIGCFGQFVIQ